MKIERFLDIENMCEEATGCGALNFFGINWNGSELEFADDINCDEILDVLACYLDMQNDNDITGYADHIINMATRYDVHTIGSRGADDGTFDYCGTYVEEIVDFIKVMKQAKL